HAQNGAAIGLDLAAGARLAVAEHDGFVPAHHRQHETRRAGAEPQDRAAHGGRVFKNDIARSRARRRAGEYERETRGQAVRSRGHGTLDKGGLSPPACHGRTPMASAKMRTLPGRLHPDSRIKDPCGCRALPESDPLQRASFSVATTW